MPLFILLLSIIVYFSLIFNVFISEPPRVVRSQAIYIFNQWINNNSIHKLLHAPSAVGIQLASLGLSDAKIQMTIRKISKQRITFACICLLLSSNSLGDFSSDLITGSDFILSHRENQTWQHLATEDFFKRNLLQIMCFCGL